MQLNKNKVQQGLTLLEFVPEEFVPIQLIKTDKLSRACQVDTQEIQRVNSGRHCQSIELSAGERRAI